MGPRALLIYRDGTLEWRPDAYEVRHGDDSFAWKIGEVKCLGQHQRRDITGIAVVEVKLLVPQGQVTVGLFAEAGRRPPFLAAGANGG